MSSSIGGDGSTSAPPASPPPKGALNGDKEPSVDEHEQDEDDEDPVTFYDKTKSFFDSISCEATERAKG